MFQCLLVSRPEDDTFHVIEARQVSVNKMVKHTKLLQGTDFENNFLIKMFYVLDNTTPASYL